AGALGLAATPAETRTGGAAVGRGPSRTEARGSHGHVRSILLVHAVPTPRSAFDPPRALHAARFLVRFQPRVRAGVRAVCAGGEDERLPAHHPRRKPLLTRDARVSSNRFALGSEDRAPPERIG